MTEGLFREGPGLFERLWEKASDDDRAELLRLQIASIVFEGSALRLGYDVLSPDEQSRRPLKRAAGPHAHRRRFTEIARVVGREGFEPPTPCV